jgi:hypothetical protein|nr:MAG TPA: hypothetical protein [Caudoviricetes sp.]
MIKILSVKNDPKDLSTYVIKYQETKGVFMNVVTLSCDEPGLPEFDAAFKTLRKDFCILAAMQPAETVKGADPMERVYVSSVSAHEGKDKTTFSLTGKVYDPYIGDYLTISLPSVGQDCLGKTILLDIQELFTQAEKYVQGERAQQNLFDQEENPEAEEQDLRVVS